MMIGPIYFQLSNDKPLFHLGMVSQHSLSSAWIFINLAALLFKLVVRQRSKSPEHGCFGFRIASTNEGYRSCVGKYPPTALRTHSIADAGVAHLKGSPATKP